MAREIDGTAVDPDEDELDSVAPCVDLKSGILGVVAGTAVLALTVGVDVPKVIVFPSVAVFGANDEVGVVPVSIGVPVVDLLMNIFPEVTIDGDDVADFVSGVTFRRP